MPPIPTPIYHITSVKTLSAIVAQNGLWSYNNIKKLSINYVSIAHQSIQNRRATKAITCGSGGTLHDYVPFYFAPRSPMLYTISCGNVEGYTEGQAGIIHLVSNAQAVVNAGHEFVFTDGHGIVQLTQFYDNLKHLDKVDWDIMRATFWGDIDIDNDRKRRRQAEFLVYNFFSWTLVSEIGVNNSQVKEQVERTLQGTKHQPTVVVRSNWYY